MFLLLAGCSLVQDRQPFWDLADRKLDEMVAATPTRSGTDGSSSQVANPPAKAIRFEGQETVLGVNTSAELSPEELGRRLQSRLQEKRTWSARRLVVQHASASRQLLWKRLADEPDAEYLRFAAATLASPSSQPASWNHLLDFARQNPAAVREYRDARRAIKLPRLELRQTVSSEQAEESYQQAIERLRVAAESVQHPLVRADAMFLLARCEFERGRFDWAESLILQAIQIAESNNDPFQAANMHLFRCKNARRINNAESGQDSWLRAIALHAEWQTQTAAPLQMRFWLAAIDTKPSGANWPAATAQVCSAPASAIGCPWQLDQPTDALVWTALGQAAYDAGRLPAALLYWKEAETRTSDANQKWLRIAQSECLASMGQTQPASAVLSSLLTSSDPTLAAAAKATLGAAKLQQGAFQQGAALLQQALGNSSVVWPKRTKAEADWALAMLVLGNQDQGYRVLRAAQEQFAMQGDVPALLQALENERRLRVHDQDADGAAAVGLRIEQLEQTN